MDITKNILYESQGLNSLIFLSSALRLKERRTALGLFLCFVFFFKREVCLRRGQKRTKAERESPMLLLCVNSLCRAAAGASPVFSTCSWGDRSASWLSSVALGGGAPCPGSRGSPLGPKAPLHPISPTEVTSSSPISCVNDAGMFLGHQWLPRKPAAAPRGPARVGFE